MEYEEYLKYPLSMLHLTLLQAFYLNYFKKADLEIKIKIFIGKLLILNIVLFLKCKNCTQQI